MMVWRLEDDNVSTGERLADRKMPTLAHGIEESLRTSRGKKVTITVITRNGQTLIGNRLRMERWRDEEPVIITLHTGESCCTDCWPGGGHRMPVDVLREVVFQWKEEG